MKAAIDSQDFGYILDNLSQFPKEWQDVLKEMAKDSQNFERDRALSLIKALEKAKTYGEQRVKLAKENAERIAQINAMDIPEDQKEALRKQSGNKDSKDVAKLQYDAFKDSAMYIQLFENLDTASSKMLTNMRENLVKLKENWKDLDPTQLKEMQNRLNEIDEQLAKRNPFAAIAEGLKKYNEMGGVEGQKQAEEKAVQDNAAWQAEQQKLDTLLREYEVMRNTEGVSEEELSAKLEEIEVQRELTDASKEQADASQKAAEEYKKQQDRIKDGVNALGDYVNTWQKLSDGLQTIRDYIADVFDLEDIPIVDEMLESIGTTLSFVAAMLPVIIALSGTLNTVLWSNPFIAMAGAIIATIGAVVGLIKGIINAKVERLNKKIEEQEDILHNLEKDYDALDKAIQKAFGSDYISTYNQQLKIMEAQIAAYREQARLEREKGKKADEDTANGYEEEAEKLEQKIEEMRSQVSEFMSDSDVTSAAKSFAESWIDAYKQFAFTSGAIKENFKEMIDSMVVNSLAAKIIQGILQPIFDDIDRLAQEGEELSEQDIAKIAAETEVATEKIDTAMQALMQRLAAAGINMRASGSELSGISKDIAGASEESINGLAAGINTQNFYMSYMPAISATVDAILAAIGGSTGENTAAGRGQTGQTFGDETFRGQMQRIDENISEMRYMLKSVITPKSANTNTHAVATK